MRLNIIGVKMDKLEEYFEQDCDTMDKNRPPYDFYAMGYNRAKIEELEIQIKQLQTELQEGRMDYGRNC